MKRKIVLIASLVAGLLAGRRPAPQILSKP